MLGPGSGDGGDSVFVIFEWIGCGGAEKVLYGGGKGGCPGCVGVGIRASALSLGPVLFFDLDVM